MKKTHYFYVILGLALILALPSLSQAQESPAPTLTSTPTSTPTNIRSTIRARVESNNQNIKLNQTARNEMLERQKMASGTTNKALKGDLKDIKGDIKDARGDFRDDMKDIRNSARDDAKDFMKDARNGSSTTNMERKGVRQEIELNLFKARRDTLVRQLNLALTNLKQIRERIVSRISKAEQEGKNMAEAKALLVKADAKISAAQVSIDALANLSVVATSTTATSTETSTASTTLRVRLDRPRQLGETAIRAVKDAREALNEVVKSIGKKLGLGLGHATSTPPVIPTPPATTTNTI